MCEHLKDYPYHKSFIATYDKETDTYICQLCQKENK